MNDLEITRLCAEAIKLERFTAYTPLTNDKQAMMLVKKFHIALGWNNPGWGAFRQDTKQWVTDADLNRAICECVAKMQTQRSEYVSHP